MSGHRRSLELVREPRLPQAATLSCGHCGQQAPVLYAQDYAWVCAACTGGAVAAARPATPPWPPTTAAVQPPQGCHNVTNALPTHEGC